MVTTYGYVATNEFPRICRPCGVTWHGHRTSVCWLCDQRGDSPQVGDGANFQNPSHYVAARDVDGGVA
jgi:hypothetical protein